MYSTEHSSEFGSPQQKVLLFRYKQLAVTLLYAFFNLYFASLLRRSKSMALSLFLYGSAIGGRPRNFLQASSRSDSCSADQEQESRSISAPSQAKTSRASPVIPQTSLCVGLPSDNQSIWSNHLAQQAAQTLPIDREMETFSASSCQSDRCLLASYQKSVDDLAACQQSEKESTSCFLASCQKSDDDLAAFQQSEKASAEQPLAAHTTRFDFCVPLDSSVPVDLPTLTTNLKGVESTNAITPNELAGLLSSSSGELVLVLDCRAFTAYNANHIVGALNVACSDRITKKRLGDGKIGLVDVISGPEGKEKYRQLEGGARIVIYDEGTTEYEGLPGTHPLRLIEECLRKEGKQACFLLGGLQALQRSHPTLCTAPLDSGVPLLFSPTAPNEQNEAIESAVASQILPYLFIGNYHDASNRERLAELGVTHVINVTGTLPLYFESDGICYKRLPASDSGSQNLSQYFNEAIEFIENARATEGRVLVHCQAGVSRSPSIVLAYLIARSQRSLSDAFTHVKERRPIVAPNLNFMGQLLAFEQQQQQLWRWLS